MSSLSLPLPGAKSEATAHHRHQACLERILDSPIITLSAAEREEGDATLGSLITHAEPLQGTNPYMKATLVRLTYELGRSKDAFLHHFFVFVDKDFHGDDGIQPVFEDGLARFRGFASQTSPSPLKREAEAVIDSFAEHLFQNFFLPSG